MSLKLPSKGIGYAPGTIELNETGELPVFPMTAIDEITSKTPDALFNGSAVIDIIKSCIPGIKDPWSILSTDMDAILIAIKAASTNGEMDVDSECPSCTEPNRHGVNLSVLLSRMNQVDYSSTLTIKDLTFKFKPLTYALVNRNNISQFELQRAINVINQIENENDRNRESSKLLKSINDLALNVVADTIEYIETPQTKVDDKTFILDFLKNCDRNVYTKIRDTSTELRETGEIKPLKLQCTHCQHEYTQPFTLDVANFFD
jgi:hypothetical protein